MAAPSPHKLVVMGDELLIKLAGKAVVVSEFPFFAALKSLGAGCGCKRKKGGAASTQIAAAKQAIAQLPDAKKAILKRMVNAERLRVAYAKSDGTIFKAEF